MLHLTLDTPEKIHHLFEITIDHDHVSDNADETTDLVDANSMKQLFVDYYGSKQKPSSVKVYRKYKKYFDALLVERNNSIINAFLDVDDKNSDQLSDSEVLSRIQNGWYQIRAYEKKFLHDHNKMVCVVTLESGSLIVDYPFYDVDDFRTFVEVMKLVDALEVPEKANGDKQHLATLLNNQS